MYYNPVMKFIDWDIGIHLEEQVDEEPKKQKQKVRELRHQRSQNWFYLGRWKDHQTEERHHLQPAQFGHQAAIEPTGQRRNWSRKK